MNRSLLMRVGLAVVVLAAAIQLYRPERSNPPVDPALALESGGRAPADVTAILQRSCYDCHSSRTRWPWYSNIAPMSWMVAGDVTEARKKLDFSTWMAYPPKQMSRKLETISDEVMKGDMPLKQYLMLHSDARLSDSDKSVVGDWATAEADRVLQAQAVAQPVLTPFTVHDPFIYVSTILPGKPTGSAPDEVGAQTSRALTALGAELTTAGSSLGKVVAVTVVLRKAEDFKAMNEAYAKFWPGSAPSRTTIVANLTDQAALVGISATAVRDSARVDVVNPSGWKLPSSPYNYAIRAGDTLFLSGLVSRRGSDYKVVTGEMGAQMGVIAENARAILEAAGMTLRDVVSARVFLTDTAQADAMNTAYRAWFPADPPARATVRAALTSPEYLVEVTLVAVKSADRKIVSPPNADGTPAATNPNLSPAVHAGGRLFVSGMLGATSENKADAKAETAEVLARLGRALKAAGYLWSEVTDAVVYVTDVALAGQAVEQLKAVRGGQPPAVMLAGVGLLRPDARIEIMITAAK
jgi:enamine deaminase RidA (YjgF/YER057c/UK114 family)